MDVQYKFQNACRTGNLKKAKKLLKTNPNINISANDECAFRWACVKGRLHVSQWLLSLRYINISFCDEWAFRWACVNGHLNVAQWLLQVKPDIDISASNEWAFRWACKDGHLNTALYLQSLLPFSYNVQVENNTITSYKVNTDTEENLLFMLYSLTYKGFANNLTANLVMDITKYI